VGKANPSDMSSFQKPEKKVFQGRGLVIVQPTGKAGDIKIIAQAEGLKAAVLGIKTQ
jgi:beta-galactosidase